MIKFPVSETKQLDLERRMQVLNLRESDLREDFVRGSGAGGQKINKTSVVVSLLHVPTGIEVRCQESRSQALNRFLARRLLVEKLETKKLGTQSEKLQEREKIRRQKRTRSKKAKRKMLEGKKHRSSIKSMRKIPTD